MSQRQVIALGARLHRCRNVTTLGVRTDFSDYPPEDLRRIQAADKIYHPTLFYSDLMDTMGIPTFPGHHTYKTVQNKIKQTALFQMLGIPHPRTRVYYGPRQQQRIRTDFPYPFIAKIPRGSARGRGVYLIRNDQDLERYLSRKHPAYIQAYHRVDRDLRVVIVGGRIVLAYWRVAAEGEFRTNLSAGGRIRFDPVSEQIRTLARTTARLCRWDDVGIDIIAANDRLYVLEGNMKYGTEGFRRAGIDYYRLMERLIDRGAI